MKILKSVSVGLLAILCTFSVIAQDEANKEKLDEMIIKGIQDWQIPGLSAVVVKEGKVVFSKTYGVKRPI